MATAEEILTARVRELEQALQSAEHDASQARGEADDNAAAAEEAHEEVSSLRLRLGEEGYSLADRRWRLPHLAREVAAVPPYLREEFLALVATETGDAWTPLPKIGAP